MLKWAHEALTSGLTANAWREMPTSSVWLDSEAMAMQKSNGPLLLTVMLETFAMLVASRRRGSKADHNSHAKRR